MAVVKYNGFPGHGGQSPMYSSRDRAALAVVDAAVKETARASARAARAAAPSLEDISLKDYCLLPERKTDAGPDAWRVRQTFFSSGVCNISVSTGSVWTQGRVKSSSELRTRESSSDLEAQGRFESNITRAKRTIRERCLELNADHMLTLTKRGKFQNLDELWLAFKYFNRYMTKFYGDAWRYVAVPELHSDGVTYHIHVAVKGFYWAGLVRKFWQKALGGKGNERGESSVGNIDLKEFRRVRGAKGVRRVAGYIAKYVGKGLNARNRGRRLFTSSRGLTPHRVQRWCVRQWGTVRQLALEMQGAISGDGSCGVGTCFFWSRERRDGSLMSMGFVISTDWSGVA